MKKILENLRNKPDHVKSRYVIVLSVIATVIVIGLWITTTTLTKTPGDTIPTDGPFKTFAKIFKSGVEQSKKDYKENKEGFNESLKAANEADTNTLADPVQVETTTTGPETTTTQ